MATPTSARPSITKRSSGPPTRARYWVIVFAVTLSILAYIDRVCISQAAPLISKDLNFSKSEMGLVFSAFALAYALFEIPGGWMGDWMGPRKVLMRIVIWWSAFTAITGGMWNMTSMWLCRFLFGAGEAGCFPNLTKAFSVWLPTEERVRAQGIMWTFARWGGAFTPPLVIGVLAYISWRQAFVLFGAMGVIWAVWFYKWFRDNPHEHPAVNEAEWELLKHNAVNAQSHGDVSRSSLIKAASAVLSVATALAVTSLIAPKYATYLLLAMVLGGGLFGHLWARKHRGTIWGEMLCSKSVWLLWAQYFCLSFPWYFYITWLPTYLQEHRKLSPLDSAYYAILPLLLGGMGSLFCGFVSPAVTKLTGSIGSTRRLMASLGFLGAGVMLIVSIQLDDPLYGMICMGMASFFNDLVMPGAWAACMDIGGKYAGTLSGSMNMMGNMAGFVAPMLGGYILDTYKLSSGASDWNLFLYVMAGVYLTGTIIWPFINPTKPLEG
jgi:MFS transporter, ACS family, glucarate transporter